MESYKVYIDSAAWICEANLVGTSKIHQYMIQNNHKITNNPSEADYIVINSCGLTKLRRDITINYFEKYYSTKKKNAKIIMFGCSTKIDKKRIENLNLVSIDFDEGNKFDKIFYKNAKFDNINPICDDKTKQKLLRGKNPFQFTRIVPFLLSGFMFPFSKKIRLNYNKMIDSITYKDKIFVEIAMGCAGNCSYCMIKKARGNVCSRPIKDIITDIENLYDPAKNLFLVADDSGSYGLDIKTNFFNLINEIKKRYPDLSIDLNYLNPLWLEKYPNEYIKLFSDTNINLASIPVQSGSNKILKIMNRKYDIYNIIEILKKIKKVSPKTITYTHFLIGFPGENTVDFLRTLFCSMHFDLPIVLMYSEHEDSKSHTLPHHKTKSTIILRYVLFWLFINLVIFYNLLSYPRK